MYYMDMHQWFWLSRTDVNVNRDDVYGNFAVRVWQVEHTLNIVLNHSISNKICLNVSDAPLKMIDNLNAELAFTVKTIQTAVI